MKCYEYKVKIVKHNRKWSIIRVLSDPEYDKPYTARVLKDAVEQYQSDETVVLFGIMEKKWNQYSSRYENTLAVKSKEEYRKEEVARWLGYFKDSASKGRYYLKAVEKIHELGCHEYDKLFQSEMFRIERERWISYFRNALAEGYIYHRAIDKLHDLGCHTYDEEIRTAKEKVAAQKKKVQDEKREKEKDEGIVNLVLPAYHGFGGRPGKGEIITHKSRVYKVISSYYHDSDGWSFGAMHDEWYAVKAKDITDTAQGLPYVEDMKAEREHSLIRNKYKEAEKAFIDLIRREGTHYDGAERSEPNGEVLVNTFTVYGFGDKIIHCKEDGMLWLICNNGADGDDWSINNIRTGGAGAYAFYIPADKSQSVCVLASWRLAKSMYDKLEEKNKEV